VQAAESRLKIKTGGKVPTLSVQHLIACNYMNEGCSGGWSIFNGYFLENAYLVEESCAPYKDGIRAATCGEFSMC
jgi:hypothetical protein